VRAPIAKAAYLVRANNICKTMVQEVEAIGPMPKDPIAIADAVDRSAEIQEVALQRLRALPTPPRDGARLRAMYAKVENFMNESHRFASALRAGDRVEAISLGGAVDRDLATVNALMNAYGLTVCGS
jgi:hypothetical protein